MKISKLRKWEGSVPDDAYYVFAYDGKDYRVSAAALINIISGGDDITDYIYDITEIPDGFITTFTLRYAYVEGSCRVYLRGLRNTPLTGYDYEELPPQQIMFYNAPITGSNIVVDYKALVIEPSEDGIFDEEFSETFI